MTPPARIERLAALHRRGRSLAEALPAADVARQYHPDLSPIGWHLGHCAFVESYWLREVGLGDEGLTGPLHHRYFPELSDKGARGHALPDYQRLLDWTARMHQENLVLLADPPARLRAHRLMRDHYLTDFLIQHYAQHLETMHYVLAQRRQHAVNGFEPRRELTAVDGGWRRERLPRVPVTVGHEAPEAYDNERPRRRLALPLGAVARTPVTNAEYLAFMAADGYQNARYWSATGWRWHMAAGVAAPGYWRRSPARRWYAVRADGFHELEPGAPVLGISRHEAEAFARWAGARLPHEYEWETARRLGLLDGVGGAWEWCANPLHPYPGFRPFPYDGYSLPWFDGRHFVLRGGSPHTEPCVMRPSFRNFYEAEKRYVFAGLRLAWD